jgi:hypothetical protein
MVLGIKIRPRNMKIFLFAQEAECSITSALFARNFAQAGMET